MTWPTREIDLGGATYEVRAFHPAQPVIGVADDGARKRLQARHGEGTLIVEDEAGRRFSLFVEQGGGLSPGRLKEMRR